MNTPDTEWEWISEDKWHQTWRHKEHGERQINTELLNYILTSRDSYWKERVLAEREVLLMKIARIPKMEFKMSDVMEAITSEDKTNGL